MYRFKFYNKTIHDFLVNKIGLPKGNKVKSKGLRIPKIYFANKKCLCCCLRGLFDTDGGIHKHRKHDPMIEFDSYNKELRNSIYKALLSLNLKSSISRRKVYIYAKKDIDKFFKIVGSKNIRNTMRYKIWKETGVICKIDELKESIKNYVRS